MFSTGFKCPHCDGGIRTISIKNVQCIDCKVIFSHELAVWVGQKEIKERMKREEMIWKD